MLSTARTIAAAALWLLASSATSTTLAADCGASTFGVLATSPTVSLCMNDSKIPLLTMGAAPTPEQLSVVCQTPTCRELLQILVDLNAEECTIPLTGRLRLRADLIDPAVAYCANAGLPLTSEAASTSQPGQSAGSPSANGSTNESVATRGPTPIPAPTSGAFQTLTARGFMIVVTFVVAMMS